MKQGEIWQTDLNPVKGSEQAGFRPGSDFKWKSFKPTFAYRNRGAAYYPDQKL